MTQENIKDFELGKDNAQQIKIRLQFSSSSYKKLPLKATSRKLKCAMKGLNIHEKKLKTT